MRMNDEEAGVSAAAARLQLNFEKHASMPLVDPLIEEERRMAENLRIGLSTLLEMHNPAELGSLCGSLGLKDECEYGSHAEKKAGVMRHIAEEGARIGSSLKAHAKALNLIWDGILFEYLRAEGQPLRTARGIDPRAWTLQLWRKRASSAFGGSSAFRPFYLPRHLHKRDEQPRAADLEGLLRGVALKESAVKYVEAKVRKEADYRHVVCYLAEACKLRQYEADARQYLVHELESARAQIDHYHSSLELTANQLIELERTYDESTSALADELAIAEASAQFLLENNVVEANAEKQHTITLLRAFLASPGPVESHHEPPASETDVAVLCSLAMAKREVEICSLERRAIASEASFAAAYTWYGTTRAECAVEAARVADAELKCRKLYVRLVGAQDCYSWNAVTTKARVDDINAELSRVSDTVHALEQNVVRAAPFLWPLLCVVDHRVSSLAAQAIVELDLAASIDIAWQQIERWNMDREEVQLRTYEALRGPTPKLSKKKAKKRNGQKPKGTRATTSKKSTIRKKGRVAGTTARAANVAKKRKPSKAK